MHDFLTLFFSFLISPCFLEVLELRVSYQHKWFARPGVCVRVYPLSFTVGDCPPPSAPPTTAHLRRLCTPHPRFDLQFLPVKARREPQPKANTSCPLPRRVMSCHAICPPPLDSAVPEPSALRFLSLLPPPSGTHSLCHDSRRGCGRGIHPLASRLLPTSLSSGLDASAASLGLLVVRLAISRHWIRRPLVPRAPLVLVLPIHLTTLNDLDTQTPLLATCPHGQ